MPRSLTKQVCLPAIHPGRVGSWVGAPQWDLQQALQQTLEWHRAWRDGQDMQQYSRAQVAAHEGENQ
ncbi:hypothetical protein [Pseudomonas alloputida]|uniref:hypothetical protein n=1 Tax=Pseudomonas TaxID=286 RepID=UPI003EEEA1C9